MRPPASASGTLQRRYRIEPAHQLLVAGEEGAQLGGQRVGEGVGGCADGPLPDAQGKHKNGRRPSQPSAKLAGQPAPLLAAAVRHEASWATDSEQKLI